MPPAARGQGTRLAGYLWAALTVAILGGWFVVTRLGMTRELRLWDLLALRFGVGTLLFVPVLLRARFPAAIWREGLLYALLWGVPFVLLVGLGLQLTSAAHASAITPTVMPVLLGMMAWRLRGIRPGSGHVLAYSAILVGVGALVGIATLQGRHANPWGFMALLVAALMWALYTLRIRESSLSAVEAAALVCSWSAVLYLPPYLYLIAGGSHLAATPPAELLFQVVYQGLLVSVVAIIGFNRAVAALGPAASTGIMAGVPVAAVLGAIPVLGEWPSLSEALAIAAVSVGVLVLAASSGRGRPQA